MQKIFQCFILVPFLLVNSFLLAGDMKVGIGRMAITPQGDAWLNGYANPARLHPASGVAHDLWAKAIVFEESPASRVVIVTTDVLGLSREISEDIAQKLKTKYGITRAQILLNSSHTHSGPMIWPAAGMFDYKPDDMRTVYEYTRQLVDNIIAAVDMAMADLAPMKVSSGHGIAQFGINRRDPKLTVRPVDHDVPVLKITNPDGRLKAVLFGYACHNTTLPGEYTEVNGDYAGYAQIELE
ncbi:MAG TPA: neutral/alkaline non-lysosomal ceramidase N-terminal domain-containing protein, partial [Agriterribacter sp.]|nr:neutral/alkaline non-lysosomal ceramidase N-terminal domain-containing protein [Agriterribacter sp.]